MRPWVVLPMEQLLHSRAKVPIPPSLPGKPSWLPKAGATHCLAGLDPGGWEPGCCRSSG